MFPAVAYLEWARRFHGQVRYDLATSGVPSVQLPEGDVANDANDRDVPGLLREAIARYNDVPADQAVAAIGTAHALWLAYASLVDPGDEVVVEEPGYEPLVAIARGTGAVVRRFSRRQESKFALDPAAIAAVVTPATRAVVLSSLHNPTGVRATESALCEAAYIAQSHGAHLVVDEVYAPFDDLVDDRGVFGGSAQRLAPNVVAVSSLTKCYGLGVERLGWLLGPREIVQRAEDALTATVGLLPIPHARRGLRAFAHIVQLARRARAIVGSKRERVAAWTLEHGLGWSDPPAGLFGFVTVPGATDLRPAIEHAARTRGVLVTPGVFFGAPGGFRIAWSADDASLAAGLEQLAEALRSNLSASNR
jgi:aspartate/methionine/tyrosine aminotransferase